MMLVKVLQFGSNWWARFGHDLNDPHRYTRRAAYFNSSGLPCGNKVKRCWVVPGLIRFNGVGDFNPQFPSRSLGTTFECTDMVFALGGNRIVFQKKAVRTVQPDYFLVVVSTLRCGAFDCRFSDWKSESVLPIAVSYTRDRQEAMVLMKPAAWVRTALGVWELKHNTAQQPDAALELVDVS